MPVKHTYRTKEGHYTSEITMRKAVRLKCRDCSCWNDAEIKRCPVKLCALWPFRTGLTHSGRTAPINAFRKREATAQADTKKAIGTEP
jgi:hypothetical protein